MWKYNNLEELYHHGILGMRWGFSKKKYPSKDYRRVKSLRKKKISQMSNNELNEINKRLDLESRYNIHRDNRNVVNRIIKGVTTTAATIGSLATAYTTYQKYGKKIVDKYLNKKA